MMDEEKITTGEDETPDANRESTKRPAQGRYNGGQRGENGYRPRNGYRNNGGKKFPPYKKEALPADDDGAAETETAETPEIAPEQVKPPMQRNNSQRVRRNKRSENNRRQAKLRERQEDEYIAEDVVKGEIISEDGAEISSAEIIAETIIEEIEVPAPFETAETTVPMPSEPVMVEIIGVRFKKSGKIYYFSPSGFICGKDSNVIVETARGIEYGSVVIPNRMVSESEIVPPLRNMVRLANEEDDAHYKENGLKEIEAYNICVEKIAEHRLAMKLIDVEYTFDNNKLLFYFTHDGRVDFRELVKDLASVFRTRIELRQIGTRDEAKMMGGLGVCGRPFCCHSFLGDFSQMSITIKMAKEQNLSLNSAKISGACGRLMCCLRYEYDVYEEEIKKTPPVDSIVETPDGDGIVIEIAPLAGMVKVRSQKQPEQPPKVYPRESVKVKGFIKREEPEISEEEVE